MPMKSPMHTMVDKVTAPAKRAYKSYQHGLAKSVTAAGPFIASPMMKMSRDRHQEDMAKPIQGKATGPKFPASAEGKTHSTFAGAPTQNEDEEGEDMQLNAQERTELVDNLIANCASWQFEGADEVLNALPDENLIALNTDNNLYRESSVVFNQLQKTFNLNGDMLIADVPKALKRLVTNAPGAAYDGSGGGDIVGKGGEEDEEQRDDDRGGENEDDSELDESDGEGEYAGDQQTKDSHQGQTRNQRNKPMTTREWMAAAPPEIQVIVRNALRVDEERKAQFIEVITANANNPYSPEQLSMMTTEQLEPLSRLAETPKPVVHNNARREIADFFTEPARKPVVNGRGRADFRGAAAPINNRGAATVEDDEDGPLLVQNTDWKKLNEELHGKRS